VSQALVCAALMLTPALADAAEPEVAAATVEGPLEHEDLASEPWFELAPPTLHAYVPGPVTMIAPPPVIAKRQRDRTFDSSMGERDPRVRQRPRTHRFRLAIHAQWVRLTNTTNIETGETTRFHYAPLMLDLGYQAQFLKYVMVRLAVAVGGNVANSRHGMPISVLPQFYVGYQGKVVGLAFGYAFDWTIPPTFDAVDPAVKDALREPVITRNHVVTGELSATSKIDKVAMTFSLALGGMQSDLSHYDTTNRKWRFYMGLQAGVFFDGTRRREKKARKAAENN
jgi:hypothetical protein